jgi:predicted GNAT family N-acyltransferase
MDEWVIEGLGKNHIREGFCCGKAPLDVFIATQASQYEKRQIGRTFVARSPGDMAVAGYYTLAASSVRFENLPPTMAAKLPRHPIPTVLLGRLAVDQRSQGQRLGETLLIHALKQALNAADTVAVFAVEVHAKDGQAAAFYAKYGFIACPSGPLHLFLPMGTIKQSFGTKPVQP